MHDKGFTEYSLMNIINKMKKLRQRFKKEADKRRKSGSGRGKLWKFYRTVDDIIGHRPNIQPIFSIDTSTPYDEEKNDKKTSGSTITILDLSCCNFFRFHRQLSYS